MSQVEFEFKIYDRVMVSGVVCIILAREIDDDEADYLCEPINKEEMILGQSEHGRGWVRTENIKRVEK